MRNQIVTAVKQRFSIRKLSIGAASVLLGTSLYFMSPSTPVVHADTTGAPAAPEKEKTDTNDPVVVAGDSTKNDADVNNAIDKYAEYALEHDLKNKDNKAIIRPSDKQPVKVNTIDDRVNQVKNIQNDIQKKIDQANQGWDAINTCKKSNNHEIVDGKDSSYFENQSLSVDDEKDSEINQITVTDGSKTKNVNTKLVDKKSKNIDGLVDGISKNIDGYGINITHTSKITDKEKYTMKVNSNNKVIVDFQTAQCQGKETTVTKEITVTYDNLNNSYYLQNKTNRIKISRIDRTFSSIQVADNPHLFTPDGQHKYENDATYDKCDGPQLIIYNDPSDGFFYNNIQQISVKDTYYYDDKGKQTPINFDTKDPAWVFVTSLNSNGGGNVEKVRAQGLNNSPVNAEKIKGSTVTVTNHNDGWWYSDKNNWFGQKLDWDNNNEYNRFGFVGTVAFQYHPGMTLQYRADDSQWGSHWACMQTQVVSSLNEDVIIYGHIKDKTENVTRKDTVTRTIHYLYDNGNTAQPDKTQTVSFNETGTKDDVTGETTWSNDNAQSVDSVNTPSIVGYTPDKSSIEKQSFKFGDPDINVTVTYHANAQTAKIIYIDDTTKNNLDSKDANGKFGQAITFATAPSDEIASYKKQGYKLVSNDFNDNKYQADNNNNVFYVHFVHDTKKVSREHSASFTVHYIYKDSRQAKPDHEQTLSFTEDGSQDLVTQKITWTPADSQKFDDATTPVITGYTPDQDKVIGQTANFETDNREATVTYLPNVQIGHINYIDDNTGKTLTRDDFSGRTNEHEDYTSIDRIQEFENKGYELVSNDYPNGGFNFDDNDQQDQVFNVHLKHGTVTVTTKNPQTPNTSINPDPHSPKYPKDIGNTNHDVKRTIDYKFKDGKPAQPTVNDSLHFERTVVIDKVTGDVLSDTWTPSQDFNDIQTPAIQGYTPDKAVISDKNIGHDHQDIIEHVVYSPDTQHMTITYIDDTTGETLHTDNPNGVSDQDTNYTTGNTIKQYEEKHYKLVSDSTKGQDLIFDHDDNANQTYEVHFVHNTHAINQTTSPKQTIHYVYADGLASQGKVTDDNVQQLSFKRDGYNDEVTGLDHWNAWTPANSNYNTIDSPVIKGYTPDKLSVDGSIVNPTDKDIEITVTYNANKQTAKITYIDDTTNTKLDSKDASGKFGQTITFETTPADEIETYKKKGYVFVSNSFDNQTYQAVDSNNSFEVHLKHGTVTVTTKNPQTPNTPINQDPQSPKYPKDINNTNKDVKRTIDYKYSDGKTAQPTVNDSLHFERTVVIDKVTGDVVSDIWTPSQDFNDIQTPAIQGYTSDRAVVSDKNIGHDHQNIVKHVVYSPDTQHMTITYIDDTTGETLHTDNPNGVSDQDAKYTTGNTIKQYEDKHYKLISDSTKGQDLIFDHDDNANQTYEVHFVHNTHAISQTTSPKQTIHYVYVNGLARQGKAIDDNVQQLSFKRDGYNDEVTGIDHWNAWTPVNSQYEAVDSPVIQGYTPDKLVVEKSTVNPTDKDIEVTVTYSADKQATHVIYIDKTTNTTLASKDLSGKSDEDSEYNTEDKIGQYKSLHYVLFEDETNGKNVVFDHNDKQDQTYYVYFVHGTQKVNRQDTVTSTINYKFEDGKAAQPTVTRTKQFSEDGVKDLVTGKTTWTKAEPQKFDDVATKSIVGYTPDKDTVTGSTVNFGDKDVEVTVTYHNNAQTAKITYVDDMTKNTLASDSQNGKFDHEITFEHDPAEVIKGLEEKGYKLVSDNFKQGVKYQNDNKSNSFEVHLEHGTKNVSRNDDVKMTAHYVMDDGSKAPNDSTQTLSFTENGTQDLVTKDITWTPADSQTLKDVDSPVLTGYTADIKTASGKVVNFGDSDINVTVHYSANAQTAKITYIDDTEKKTLGSDQQNGKFDHEIVFERDPAEVIKGLEEKGYKLISDNFKPGIKYQSDNKSNSFEVHLVHTYEPVETSQTITETVHYIDANGKPVAPDHVAKVVIKVTGTRDKVTDSITWNAPSTGHFDEVISPIVPNMTPDKKFIPSRDVQYGDGDITENVVYTPNEMPREPEKPNDQGKSNSKNSGKTNKSGNPTSKTSEKSNDQGKPNSKTSKKPNNSDNSTSMTPKKRNKSGKDVSKQFGTLTKATISEKSINSRTADNGVSTKSTAKRELPQTGATTNIGIWIGLVSMIAGLGLLGASKKRKKN